MKKGKKGARRLIVIMLSMMMAISLIPGMVYAEGSSDASQDGTEAAESTYVPGQVIVMFKDGAVSETKLSLKDAKALKQTGKNFGAKLNSVGEAAEAASDAESEISILKESLGSAFTIEDTLEFGDNTAGTVTNTIKGTSKQTAGISAQTAAQTQPAAEDSTLRIALVSSEKYDTEEMIALLSENENVAAAEPNSYTYYTDYADYALDDTYASYLYHDNSPGAKNTAGDSVADRGFDPEKIISTNAGSGWSKLTGEEDEVVVAVIDSGINLEHEDLVNVLWTNPGDIGLSGEHGYNFAKNSSDIMDENGHGSHCAGIIAAQANNGKGVAGVASGAKVKIMALSTDAGEEEGSLYVAMGAFNYVIRAKERGVNIVATSNSWGRSDQQSSIFNEIVDRMGEAGIISFFAAGNSHEDMDQNHTDNPASNESQYSIVVGAAGINGKPTGFTNFGKQTVDLFAPGLNILSTVGYKSYMPNLYSEEKLLETTEYFGKFTSDMTVTDGTITPTTGGVEGIEGFGAVEFHKQYDEWSDIEAEDIPGTATCEMEIVPEHYFTIGEKAASLKVTIKEAQLGEEYYVFFPYEKNEDTVGGNTTFSIFYQGGENSDRTTANCDGGEIYMDEEGKYVLTGYGEIGHALDGRNYDLDTHLFASKQDAENPKVIDYEEGVKTGIGLKITPVNGSWGNSEWRDGNPHDLVLYIDSVAVSKPDYELSLEDSYEMMSGTSMACPSAAGAGALMAALNPKQEDQTPAEYATMIRSKIFSCVTQTDELKDLCSTGGYIDFRNLDADNPAITDAVCNVNKGTITLKGINFKEGMQLSYSKVLDPEAPEVVLPANGMTFDVAEDGKSIVISNAKSIFGTFIEFTVKDGSKSGKGGFFLVKGQKKLDLIAYEHYPNPAETDYTGSEPTYQLFTNAKGTGLFAIDRDTGDVSKFDGKQFVKYAGGILNKEVNKLLIGQGYDEYQIKNNISVYARQLGEAVSDGNKCYVFVTATYTDPETWEEETTGMLATIDVSAKDPVWTFREMDLDSLNTITNGATYEFLDGKLYTLCVDPDSEDFSEKLLYSFDPETLEVKLESELPKAIFQPYLISYKGDMYCMFGSVGMEVNEDVFKYDSASATWEVTGHLRYDGKCDEGMQTCEYQKAGIAVNNGIVFVNMSFDGAGNVTLYDPETDELKPLYYTLGDGINDQPMWGSVNITATQDGIYYIRDDNDELRRGFGLWKLPAVSGAYQNPYARLNKTSASMKAGGELTLKAIGGKVKSWKSSAPKVVKVKSGKLTALKKGSATITATLNSGMKVKCKVKVTTSPKLSKTSIKVKKGKTVSIKITGKANGVNNVYKNTKTAKVISGKTVKTIKVKGLKKGSTTLTIKVNGVVLKLKVTVI
ncbi:MAG: S8 family serine peptidase [Clostridiales bacterium]|nr:S8 family serine peptidase [Clostridiales bacterium]